MGERFRQLIDFLKYEIWEIHLSNLKFKKAVLIKSLRVLILSIRGFGRDKCQLRASALTFYSLTSIVPIAAMMFGIAKGFGLDKILEEQLRERLAGQEQILDKVIEFSHSMLANARGGVIAGIGLIVLFWAVINVLGQIEDAMSDIWKIKEQRPFGRKFGDYLSIMLICPVLIILSGSLTVFVTTQVTLILNKIYFLGALSPVILFALKLLPLILVWAVFTFIYMFMPNTRVHFSAGLLGGVVAGTLYHLVQWIYINLQVVTAGYNAIYGSFAALPLFLIWLQISWIVVLFGAELSWAGQNVGDYEFEPECSRASHHIRILLSLRIMHYLVRCFAGQEKPPAASEIARELDIPKCLVDRTVSELAQSRLISEVEVDGERGFQPALDINVLRVQYVIDALEHRGIDRITFAGTQDYEAITKTLDSFRSTIEKLPANKLLKDL